MNDKIFQEKILNLEKHVASSNYKEAVKLLEELRDVILPNDLEIYLSIKSLSEDLIYSRNIEYIKKDIKIIKERLIFQRLPKSQKISNFLISVISYTAIPLVPFVANYILKEETTNKDIILSFAMYCIGITLSFRSPRDRIFGIFLSIIIFLLVDKSPQINAVIATYLIATIIIIMHVLDRINRHIKGNEPYT